MDTKITKQRLFHLFSYEWVAMIFTFIGLVLAWNFIFQVTSVKPTRGQIFKYFVDYNITAKNEETFFQFLTDDQALDTLNILKLEKETLYYGANDVLFARLQVNDGDVIFTEAIQNEQGEGRAQNIIDNGYVYTFNNLLNDAKTYLDGFKTNGAYDDAKISAHFLSRMEKDNRFKSDKAKAEGVELEKNRILRLDKEVSDFEYLINCGEDIFYKYTRYSQSVQIAIEENKPEFEYLLNREIRDGRENAIYGIQLNAIVGGTDKVSTSSLFSVGEAQTAEGVILMAFNFLNAQPDEQFEVITFINSIVRNCSNLYQGR